MTLTLKEFVNKYNGKFVEYHSYGDGALNQCADLVNQYIQEVLELTPIIGTNAVDFPEKANKKEFEFIENTPTFIPQPGDIVVWDLGNAWGHIGIIKSANINTFRSFDQNWPTGSPCVIVAHGYKNVRGVLRPINVTTKETGTDLDKVLTHTKTKTADELITVWDQEMGFLDSERKKNKILKKGNQELEKELEEVADMSSKNNSIVIDMREKEEALTEELKKCQSSRSYFENSLKEMRKSYKECQNKVDVLAENVATPQTSTTEHTLPKTSGFFHKFWYETMDTIDRRFIKLFVSGMAATLSTQLPTIDQGLDYSVIVGFLCSAGYASLSAASLIVREECKKEGKPFPFYARYL